ncbi:MAG: AraC family transcriptional regulator [Hyphomicrobiales bacterium]|nr:AraC family transcriptional regulator [Hyphomicrobiales bacterium]MCP4999059.1 AraC family transcriptional regulator [Hyphomicrobiales bacterium]
MVEFTRSEVFFHTTDPHSSPWPYSVPVGGRTLVVHRDGMVRRRYHQHVLILTLSGQGRIEADETTFAANPQSVVWLDTARKYGHGAKQGEVWAYLWLAMSGHGLGRLHEQIALLDSPVMEGMGDLQPRFEDIVQNLAGQPPTIDATLSAQVAAIIAALFSKRVGTSALAGSDPITKLMRHLRRKVDQTWEIDDMAEIAGLSPSQLFRRFKDVAGTSPISWLRQERMLLARHLLTGTTDTIASIAHRCGYSDPFHFSRDFKRHNGCAPRNYRANTR